MNKRNKKASKIINKFCKKLDEKRFYETYGKVFQVTTKKLILLIDTVVPAFWIIALMLPKKYNIEFARITIKKD